MRIVRHVRIRASARACERACTPEPITVTLSASVRARRRVANADPAAVRVAVMYSPSMTASGVPVSGSKQQISAWCVGRSRFSGNRLTSLVVSAFADGR
jgi:hypothetical protein